MNRSVKAYSLALKPFMFIPQTISSLKGEGKLKNLLFSELASLS
jgi:hypothetical protein